MVLARILSSSLHLNYAVSVLIVLFLLSQLFHISGRFRTLLLREGTPKTARKSIKEMSLLFSQRRALDENQELVLLIQSFFCKSAIEQKFDKKEAIIASMVKNNKRILFFTKANSKKNQGIMKLAYEVETLILDRLDFLKRDRDASLSTHFSYELLDARNDLISHLGKNKDDLLSHYSGRALIDVIDNITNRLACFLSNRDEERLHL